MPRPDETPLERARRLTEEWERLLDSDALFEDIDEAAREMDEAREAAGLPFVDED